MLTPAVLWRQSLKFFVREVYRQLHPGEPPVALTPHMKAMCYALEQTYYGECRRLAINVPPRHGKSITTAVAFSAWLLGQDPRLKMLVGTYNEELARQHDQQVRRIMESAEYRAAFPGTVIDRRATRQLDLRTTQDGMRLSVTTGGSGTGFGGDYIILDDCMKAQDANSESERERVRNWYSSTIGTRLNSKRDGVIISIQQRLHEDDLTAYMLDTGAEHLCLPAIAEKRERIRLGPDEEIVREPGDLLWPEQEDQATLDRIRRENGLRVFAAQWQQDPTPAVGNIVRLEWFDRYDDPPPQDRLLKVVQSWDTATSVEPNAAWSVCTTWGYHEKRWYLLDVFRERLEFYDLKHALVRLWERWQPDKVLIEKASNGDALWSLLKAEGPFRPMLWPVAKSKEERLIAQTGQLEARQVVLPNKAPWLATYLHELKGAPNCRFWDQVDSTTQFLDFELTNRPWVERRYHPDSGRRIMVRKPTVGRKRIRGAVEPDD